MNKSDRQKLLAIGLSEEEIDNLLEMQRKDNEARKEYARKKKRFSAMPYFPVELISTKEGCKIIMNSAEMDFYIEHLSQFGFYGNGHCWAGILEQLLKTSGKNQFANFSIDSNSDSCMIIPKTSEIGEEVAKYIHQILSDKKAFTKLLSQIDKSKIDC